MRVGLAILIIFILSEGLSAASSQVATKEDIKMLREDIKMVVEMMNKRFEDVNKRFEDMRSYMQTVFMVLGVLNGMIIIILGVIGWRVTQRIKQEQILIIKDMLRRTEIWDEIFQNPQVVEKIAQKVRAKVS